MTDDAPALPYLVREPTERTDGPPPAVILLHGYGSDAHGLFALAERLDGRFMAFVPQGSVPLENGGWGWYWLGEATPLGRVADASGMDLSRRDVLHLADFAARGHGADPSRVYLLGHSQGGALALCVALTEPERIAGMVAMSGRVIPEVLPMAAAPERMRGLRVFLAHGVDDPVVPVRHARAARDLLVQRGAVVDFREYPAEHTVPPEMVADVNAWLVARAFG